ncbi:MAG TPA: hypothetical protein VGO96_03755 [Pyrinomonadaceae bacterium]|jgi:hypothetical protein|nr:hypothetical protein [Pyrinomonadaceae bacterium]
MFNRGKIFSALAAVMLVAASVCAVAPASAAVAAGSADKKAKNVARVSVPLNLAVLVQDDLVSRVGNEIDVTREFIRELPAGSRVMVGYLTSGSLQVRQKFTEDLEQAGRALRIPAGTETSSPYNPYVEVVEALRHFEADGKNRNVVLLISDGLDVSRGFDSFTSINSIDMERAVREAKRRNVVVYSFYAPAVGLTSSNRQAVSFGQGALNRLSNETGGRAFFQGTSFVSFNPYFERLSRTLNNEAGVGF